MFAVEIHELNKNSFRVNVKNIYESTLISILELDRVLEISDSLYPINLSTTKSPGKGMILHTFNIIHSVNINARSIYQVDCIIDDRSLNEYLFETEFCMRQLENSHCVSGNGEQFYDSFQGNDVLHGVVVQGHNNQQTCLSYGSIVVQDLNNTHGAIQNRICSIP